MKGTWKRAHLGDVADVSYGFTAKASFEEIGPKFLRITDIQRYGVDWDAVPSCDIPKDKYDQYRLCDGDIVFARTGATTGKSFLLSNTPEAVAASYLIRLRIKNTELLPQYVAYFFQTSEYWDAVNAGTTGSAQGGFNASKLCDLEIQYPTRLEQKRIVAILDDAFERIDTAIANTEKCLANAKEFFESYASDVFNVVKNGWPIKTFESICENLDSRRIPITKSKRIPGDIPYYGASGVVDYVKDYIFDDDLLLVSEDGANLLARTYPIAFSVSGKTWVNNHAHVLKFNNKASQIFVEYYLNSISLKPFVSGMAQPKLNQKSMNSIPVPFPTLSIQQDIANKLSKIRQLTSEIKETKNRKAVSLIELKQSLLQKAFSGELTTDFNPNALEL